MTRGRRIASFPAGMANNPYGRLLYGALERLGYERVEGGTLESGWLREHRAAVGWLHLHWDELEYESEGGALASWLALARYGARLAAARALGYRIAWTIHEVLPRETRSVRRDLVAAKLRASLAHVLIAHDRATAGRAARVIGRLAERVHVVPHGSYAGVYLARRPREEVRASLGLEPGARVFLCFGHLRAFKEVELLLDAFAGLRRAEARLLVVGEFAWRVQDEPWERALARRLARTAAADPRLSVRLGFVPEEEVGDLFAAADVVVSPRGDGWTSGSLILALSQRKPVIAARREAYAELVPPDAGWLFVPHDPAALTAALDAAAAASEQRLASMGEAAAAVAASLSWEAAARRIAALFEAVLPARGSGERGASAARGRTGRP